MNKITIAIDGYSSCGKSTLAKTLAMSIDYSYVDTGAMYRCVTLYALENGIIKNDQVDKESLVGQLDDISISFQHSEQSKESDAYLNGVNVEETIRGMDISNHVSQISIIKEVREKMVAMQQKMGKEKGVIMEGRDIGTVVFPDAELKVFMTASIEVRVKRRYDEMQAKGLHVSVDDVKENVLSRDYEDTHRKHSPLVQADDAVVLDNSDLSEEDQLNFMLKLVEQRT
ncbi:MAG TPA: (d)CMP kinase [Flavobacteriales bacterium]|nr:(d)CMP kinase [Flavobacteriales bacterium]HIO67745.1 (d)CMP kinase [Flavobacteriales bacterium]